MTVSPKVTIPKESHTIQWEHLQNKRGWKLDAKMFSNAKPSLSNLKVKHKKFLSLSEFLMT